MGNQWLLPAPLLRMVEAEDANLKSNEETPVNFEMIIMNLVDSSKIGDVNQNVGILGDSSY